MADTSPGTGSAPAFKAAQTVPQSTVVWVAYTTDIYFHNSGGWKSKISVLAHTGSGESWVAYIVFSHAGKTARELSGGSFIRPLIPFTRVSPHYLITFQRTYLLIPSHLELRFRDMNFGGTQNPLCNNP